MQLQKLFLAVSATVVIGGCASTYDAPASDIPSAKIVMEKGYEDGLGIGKSSVAVYAVQTSDTCKIHKQDGLARMTWISGAVTEKSVEAGEPITLLANITKYDSLSGGGYWNGYGYSVNMITTIPCLSRVSFIPEAGKTYRFTQREVDKNVCEVDFADAATNLVPADAVVENEVFCKEDVMMPPGTTAADIEAAGS